MSIFIIGNFLSGVYLWNLPMFGLFGLNKKELYHKLKMASADQILRQALSKVCQSMIRLSEEPRKLINYMNSNIINTVNCNSQLFI